MSISREHIVKEVRRTAEANGGKPLGRLRFFSETGIKESDWRGTYWARWNDVLAEAGFDPNSLVEPRSNDTLLEKMAELAIELGKIPVNSEMLLKKRSDETFPNAKTFARFGSKAELLAHLREYSLKHTQYLPIVEWIDAAGSSAPAQLQERKQTDVEMGHVYLIRSGKFHKIGRSNAAGRREREIALQLPEKASMVHVIQTDDPIGIEAYWHRRFAERRKNGEWFALTAADISAFRRRKFM